MINRLREWARTRACTINTNLVRQAGVSVAPAGEEAFEGAFELGHALA